MGRLLREVMAEGYRNPPPELIPELLLLGELEHVQLSLDNGQVIEMDMIRYKGMDYAMKVIDGGVWYGTRTELLGKGFQQPIREEME